MMEKKIESIEDLIAKGGGALILAYKLGLNSQMAVEMWRQRGVPLKHWPKVISLTGTTANVLLEISNKAKQKQNE